VTAATEPAARCRGVTADWAPRSVLDTMHAVFVARALYTVVRLGVVDELARGPRSCADLAALLGVEAVPLHQIVRAVATTGMLGSVPGAEVGTAQVFALTAMGEALREGHPSATRDLVLTMQGPTIVDSLGVLPERVATGRTGPEITRGKGWFDHLRDDQEEAAAFNRMMVAIHGDEPDAVAAAYDIGWASHVTDVGGGMGGLVLALVAANHHLRGTVFDLPDVAEHAAAHLRAQDTTGRCRAVGGDFFDFVPGGSDAYLLSHVLHDWDDENCVRILCNCAAGMAPGSRLLLVEMVLPDGDEPHPGKVLDLVMVTLTRGRERTAEEYRRLLALAGLRMTAVVPTDSPVSIVEAVPEPLPEPA
jgi:hypothetical protein